MDFGIKYLFAATFVYEALLVHLRPRYLVTQWYISLGYWRRRLWYFLKYLIKDAINYVNAPGLPWEAEGRWPWHVALTVAWLHVYQMLFLLLRSSGHVQNDASRGLQEGAGVRSICTIDVAGCLLMVPHVLCSPAAGTTFELLPVGREGCRVVPDTCKAVRRIMSTCSTSKAKKSRAHEEAGQRRRVRGVPASLTLPLQHRPQTWLVKRWEWDGPLSRRTGPYS